MIKRILLAMLVLTAVVLPIASASAHTNVIISAGYGGYYPAYYGYYPGYYAPPTVVYAQPPVVYAQPQPVAYAQPQPVVYQQAAGIEADQTSPTYTDGHGRTCREYQSTATVGGSPAPTYGTACLQPDGTWHIVK